jgi:hypothetical protein
MAIVYPILTFADKKLFALINACFHGCVRKILYTFSSKAYFFGYNLIRHVFGE